MLLLCRLMLLWGLLLLLRRLLLLLLLHRLCRSSIWSLRRPSQ
jgi:hypothetical protein